jgi:hypothetical protein
VCAAPSPACRVRGDRRPDGEGSPLVIRGTACITPVPGLSSVLMFTTDQRPLVFEELGRPTIDRVVVDGPDRLVAAAALPGSQAVACVAARRAPALSLERIFQDHHINAKAGELP